MILPAACDFLGSLPKYIVKSAKVNIYLDLGD
jgi:hypothetical protein